jgi:hypothetical protein
MSLDSYRSAVVLMDFRTRWHRQPGSDLPQLSLYDRCCMIHDHPPNCTNKWNSIYGLLGLARENTRIMPNCDLTVMGVFLEFTWSVLLNEDMDILRHAVFLGDDPSQPSFLFKSVSKSWGKKVCVGTRSAGRYRGASVEIVRPASVRVRGVAIDRISRC